jgi:hypothetical protein
MWVAAIKFTRHPKIPFNTLGTISFIIPVCPSTRHSVRMGQLGSHWTNFHEILYLRIFFRNSVEKTDVSLKSDKNNGYLQWRPIYLLIISSSVLLRMRNISNRSCRENQNTHFVFKNLFSIIVPFMRQCGKILQSGADNIWQYGACALHAGYLRLRTHTQNV